MLLKKLQLFSKKFFFYSLLSPFLHRVTFKILFCLNAVWLSKNETVERLVGNFCGFFIL